MTEEDIQKNQLQQEEEFSEALQFEAECKENGSDQTAISESYPLPQKGMKVIYASDGFVLDIVDEEGENVSSQLDIASMNLNNTATASTNATKVLIASWGANNNRLYRKTLDDGTTKIVGFGRATTFADKTGQRDHTLEKGDVATKRDYDNCKYGIEVKVKTKKNGTDTVLTKSMKKCDVGSMPDAIVDIWKTGVSYWGYTYSSSFSMPDEVKIVHADSY